MQSENALVFSGFSPQTLVLRLLEGAPGDAVIVRIAYDTPQRLQVRGFGTLLLFACQSIYTFLHGIFGHLFATYLGMRTL
jgi:hypothetical protein